MARSHPRQPLIEPTAALPRQSIVAALNAWLQSRSGAAMLWFVLTLTLIQGCAYLVIVPPWQHYDEPTHFEYAWLVANQGRLPQLGDEDPALRREILNTLFATDFFRSMPAPPLLTDHGEVWLGVTELGHPPLYYALVSIPLRLVSQLDILSQLYVARGVSLLLFLGTVAIAFGLLRELLPWPHPLRWMVPLALALIPTFADVMTSVNNDVGAAFVGSLALWGAVRLIRRGLNWRDLAWTISAAVCAPLTKNTAAIMLPLAVIAIVLAVLARVAIARRYLVLGAGVVLPLCASLLLTWGDASGWYRWSSGAAQADPTQQRVAAPVGDHALLLEVDDQATIRQLINPLHTPQVLALKGQTVTVGGWLWSDHAGEQARLGVRYSTSRQRAPVDATTLVTLTTTPVFTTWTFAAPRHLAALSFLLIGYDSPTNPEQRIWLDGAVVVAGDPPAATPPQFDTTQANTGEWSGKPFANLLTNGSGEQSGPRVQPWFEHLLYQYIHRSPAQIVAAIFDLDRVGQQLMVGILPQAFDSFVGWFAWGDVQLNQSAWVLFARCFGLVSVASALFWLVSRRSAERQQLFVLLLLAIAVLIAWGNTVLRPLPLLGENDALAVARYTFPAIIATALTLIGGVWVLVPQRFRVATVLTTLVGMVVLNIVALNLIWQTFL